MNGEKTCQQCYKYYNQTIAKTCAFCQEISFSEIILCDLTREDQREKGHIKCKAFKPNLSLVTGDASHSPAPCKFDETTMMHDIEQSSKAKWFRAFSSQQTHEKPGDIVYNLKFHLCLVTTHRRPLFSGSERYITHIAEIVQQSGNLFEGTVYLLEKGPDHLHIYIDSTPDYSIQELVENISASVEIGILKNMSGQHPRPLFSKEYFMESMGTGNIPS